MKEKRCSTCKDPKPLSEFYTQPRAKDGHASQCKVCIGNQQKKKLRETFKWDRVNLVTGWMTH